MSYMQDILGGLLAISSISFAAILLLGPDRIIEICYAVKKINIRVLAQKTKEPISDFFHEQPLLVKYPLYFGGIVFIFLILVSTFKELVKTLSHFWASIFTILLTALTGFILYLLFSLLCLIIKTAIENILYFTEKFETKISNNIQISMVYLVFILVFSLVVKTPPLITYSLLIAVFLLHIVVFRGMILIIVNTSPFKKKEDSTIKNLLITMFVWLIILVISIYTEVILCFHCNSAAFVIVNKDVVNLLDLLYFSLLMFTTGGFGEITPSSSLSKVVTIGISISSVIYLILFIGAIVSEFAGKKENNN